MKTIVGIIEVIVADNNNFSSMFVIDIGEEFSILILFIN